MGSRIKNWIIGFLLSVTTVVHAQVYNISNIINVTVNSPLTNSITFTNSILATNNTVINTNIFQISNIITNFINVTNIFNNNVTNLIQYINSGSGGGITNLILQPVDSSTNYLSFSNSANGAIGYLTYTVTNGGGGSATLPTNLVFTTSNNTFIVGTTQIFDTILVNGQDVNTNFLNIWNYLTNYPLTGITFNALSSPSNYVALNSISGLTAYVDYCVTNGGGAGISILSMTVSNFGENAAIIFTNSVIVSILDNNVFTNETITTTFNKLNQDCLDRENFQHTLFFYVDSTNGYAGYFSNSVAGTRVQPGMIMRIDSQDVPIYSITNGGTGVASVVITKWLEPNTTKPISGIFGVQNNLGNTAVAVAGGTNDITRVVGGPINHYGSAGSGGANPRMWSTALGNIIRLSDTEEDFVVSRMPNIQPSGAIPSELSLVFRYKNGIWREYGTTALRWATVNSSWVRLSRNPVSKTVYATCPRGGAQGFSGVYRLDSDLNTMTYINVGLGTTNNYSHVYASTDDQIIYVCASGTFGVWLNALSGNGGHIFKSTNAGVSFTALTNMGIRYWASLFTLDGTNLYAGTYSSGGTAGAAGIFYSPDGGDTIQTTSVRTAGSIIGSFHLNAATNLVVPVDGLSVGTNNGIYQTSLYSTNFVKITQNTFQIGDFATHPTDTNVYYWLTSAGLSNVAESMAIAKITNLLPQSERLYPDKIEYTVKGADYRSVTFAPANPNVGYLTYSREADSPGDGRILKTTNKGKTWTDVAPANAYWHTVATWDGQTVYASITRYQRNDSSAIYVSTNGGTSWNTLQSVPNLVKLVMPNSNTVYGILRLSRTDTDIAATATPIIQIDVSDNVVRLAGKQLNSPDPVATPFAGEYAILKNYNTNSFYTQSGVLLYNSIMLTSTNGGEYFNIPPAAHAVGLGLSDSFAMAKNSNVGYRASYQGALHKTTNFFQSISSIDVAGTAGNRAGIWVSDDGLTVHQTTYISSPALRTTTNGGTTFKNTYTNSGLAFYAVASWGDGDTVLMGRIGGTVAIATNARTAVGITGLTFVAGSPSIIAFNVINSNKIWGFYGNNNPAGVYHETTNQGINWTTNVITQLRDAGERLYYIEDHPSDTNTFWVTSTNRYWITTNNFQTLEYWNTNNTLQFLPYDGSVSTYAFDVDKVNGNKLIYGAAGRAPAIYTNFPDASSRPITPNFLNGIPGGNSRLWTGFSTYDGDTVYAAAGYYGNVNVNDYLYKLDFKNSQWSYLDNWRDRNWTDVNTADGLDIWATTRLELHKADNLSQTPTNAWFSTITSCSAPYSKFWLSIKDTLATLSENNSQIGIQTALAFSFDSNSSFVEWNGTNWSAITTNDSSQWKWWTGSIWSNAYSNTSVAALSDAMTNPTNRMTYTQITAIPDAGWEATRGFSTGSTENVYIGVAMQTLNPYAVPNIQNFTFNVERGRDQFIKKSETSDYQINLDVTNNLQTVIRKATGTVDAIINYTAAP